MKLTEDVRLFKIVHLASIGLSGAAVGSWFTYGTVVMSWAVHRPLRADPPFIYPFQDHGTIYVTASDLRLSHILLLSCGVLMLVALALHWAERLWPAGRAARDERKAREHYLWLVRQSARALDDHRRERR